MTGRGLALLVGAVLVTGVARLIGVAELYVVAAAAIVLLVLAVVVVRMSSGAVIVRRRVSVPRLHVGHTAEVVVELRNAARLPAPLLLAEDDCHPSLGTATRVVVPGLSSGQTTGFRYPVTGSVRGRWTVGPMTIRVRDPFGLAERARRDTTRTDVVVYPVVEPLGGGSVEGAHHGSGTSRTRRLFTTGDEFFTMREYVQGDDLRQVHWPSTAHRQTLMVRQQEQAWEARATVFLDTRAAAHVGGGAESTLERAVSVAASSLRELSRAGYGLRLVTPDDTRVPPDATWQVLFDQLAELHVSRVHALGPALEPLRADGRSGLLLSVLGPLSGGGDVAAAPDVRALLRAGRSYGGRATIVCQDAARGSSSASARDLTNVLAANRWRATTLDTAEPIAAAWTALTSAAGQARRSG